MRASALSATQFRLQSLVGRALKSCGNQQISAFLGPEQPEMPPFLHRADAAIYELHVRNFSALDGTVKKAWRGKYLAFEQEGARNLPFFLVQEGTVGDRHLRKLAAAGMSHVHLLPTFDFGSVPERAEDQLEATMPCSLLARQ